MPVLSTTEPHAAVQNDNHPARGARFVARQPILDRQGQTFGYELLFRATAESTSSDDRTDRATDILIDNLFLLGLDRLSDGRPVFVNCTRSTLVEGIARLLPPNRVVLEILETVEPDEEVVRACRDLKAAGYQLALDDFTLAHFSNPLLPLMDFVKVDFGLSTPPQRKLLVRNLRARRVRPVAEKVETPVEFSEAVGMGFQYYQGFFFARPQTLARRTIPAFKLNLMRLLREACRADFNAARLEEAIKSEPSICYRLLRYLNTYSFSFHHQIISIRHALTLLGENKVRQWLSLVVETAMGQDKPEELVVTCLIRARCCELLAGPAALLSLDTDLFLAGMLSAIDAILDQPLPSVLEELGVSTDIHRALIEKKGPLHPILAGVLAMEQADWSAVSKVTAEAHLSEQTFMNAYLQSLEWAHEILQT
jgi:c-di-GMP-related signal transduction protein